MSAGREYLSAREWREMFDDQDRCCKLCGDAEGPYEADHSIPNALQPGKPDQIICVPCHRAKSRTDRKVIAKTYRLNGTTSSQYDRRQKRKAEGKAPLLRGGGFQKKSSRTREQILGEQPNG